MLSTISSVLYDSMVNIAVFQHKLESKPNSPSSIAEKESLLTKSKSIESDKSSISSPIYEKTTTLAI